jgi:hypothetical protein
MSDSYPQASLLHASAFTYAVKHRFLIKSLLFGFAPTSPIAATGAASSTLEEVVALCAL